MPDKKFKLFVIDRVGQAQAGNKKCAREMLEEINERVTLGESLTVEHQEYLRWVTNRALKSTKDPFGVKGNNHLHLPPPWTQTEREVFCYWYLEGAKRQKKRLDAGKYAGTDLLKIRTEKFKGNISPAEAAYQSLLEIDVDVCTPERVAQLHKEAKRKWKLALAVHEHLSKFGSTSKNLEKVCEYLGEAITGFKSKPSSDEIRNAYIQYAEFMEADPE